MSNLTGSGHVAAARLPLPTWVGGLTFCGLAVVVALMFTGGALMPWAHILGGLLLALLLIPAVVRALPQMPRLIQARTAWCLVVGALLLCWTALQLLPLPAGWIAWLSPQAVEWKRRLGGWDSDAWSPLSLTPEVTRQFLLVWSVGFLILIATVLSIRSRHLRLAAQAIAAATGLFAVYGLVLHIAPATSEFKPFGVPLLPGRLSGPLVNPNRFAYLMEIGLPFCLLLLRSALLEVPVAPSRGRWRIWLHRLLTSRPILSRVVLWGGCSSTALVALVLTLSRGGIAATLAALAIGLPVLNWLEWDNTPVHRRRLRRRAWIGLAVVATSLCFALGWGFDALAARFSQLFSEQALRWEVWHNSLAMVRDFWLTGVGAGGFRDAFPLYQSAALTQYYRYAHNDYLNTAIDLGLPGLLLLLMFFGLWFGQVWRHLQQTQARGRIWRFAAGIAALAVCLHQFGDFGLQDPALLWYFAFVLGLGLSFRHNQDSQATADTATELESPPPIKVAVAAPNSGFRLRFYQSLALGGCALAGVLPLMALSTAWADWVRPGSQWVHLDWWRGGVQPGWSSAEIADWRDQWLRAREYQPTDSTANYQAALAEFFLLHRELSDQLQLAPSLQGPDGRIRLARTQQPRILSPNQQTRLDVARALAEQARRAAPLRPEFHLLRLRLAILADDLPTALASLPRVEMLYVGIDRVWPELTADLIYLYQRRAPELSDHQFTAWRESLVRRQLAQPRLFRQAVGVAFNRGVTLAEITAWMPEDLSRHLQLAEFLKQLNWLAEAQTRFAAIANQTDRHANDRRLRHAAGLNYLEICLRRGQLAEFEQGLRQHYPQFETFECHALFKRHLLPYLAVNPQLAGDWRRILIDRVPPALRNEVEASRLEVLGRLAMLTSDWDAAQTALGSAAEKSVDSSILYALAEVYTRRRKFNEAADCYENILQMDRGNAIRPLGLLAMCYERSGQLQKAIGAYRRLVALNPEQQQQYAVNISRLALQEEDNAIQP